MICAACFYESAHILRWFQTAEPGPVARAPTGSAEPKAQAKSTAGPSQNPGPKAWLFETSITVDYRLIGELYDSL